MNRSLWFATFGVLVVAALVLLPLSVDTMPSAVATHFGGSGDADGFMPRSRYLLMLLSMAVGMPVLLVGVVGLAATQAAPLFKVPYRAHWFAPERRAASAAYLVGHVARLGCALSLFFGGLHGLVLVANEHQPAHLPMPALLVLSALFVMAMIAWKIALRRHFHAPT